MLQKYPVTYTLIIINTIVYLISAYLSQNIVNINSQTLLDLGAIYGPNMIQDGQWWRLFTAMFLHAGATHIFMNMYSLYIVGKSAEELFSSVQYLAIYLLSGLVGGVVSVYIHPQSLGVGASGAIFGVFGALAGYFLANRDQLAKQSKAFFANFGSVIAVNFLIGLSIPSIDMSAHTGGLIAGVIGGYMISKNPKSLWIYSAIMVAFIMGVITYLSGS